MRRPVVAGNWKMHGSRSANQALLTELERRLKPEWPIDVVVFPPYVYLTDAGRLLDGGQIRLGAQDVCAEAGGAFTGQVSVAMLKDVGCRYVIIGHSERRRLYHEDDALVARKFAAVVQAGLIPVLCVGETLEEHEAHQAEAVVASAKTIAHAISNPRLGFSGSTAFRMRRSSSAVSCGKGSFSAFIV